MSSVSKLLACAALAVGITLAGCATPSDVQKVRTSLLGEMQQNNQAQQARIAQLEGKLSKVEADHRAFLAQSQGLEERVKRAEGLESDVAAVRRYARDVEKQTLSLRDATARELDRQNAHIERVKASYTAVLEQQVQMVATMSKTFETMLADLKNTLGDGVKTLKEALPASEGAVPPAPPLPPSLRGGPTPEKAPPMETPKKAPPAESGKTHPPAPPIPDSLKKAPGGAKNMPPPPAPGKQ